MRESCRIRLAVPFRYDTNVVGQEDYDDYIDGAEPWFGQPIPQAVERAASRNEGERGQVIEGGNLTQARPVSPDEKG